MQPLLRVQGARAWGIQESQSSGSHAVDAPADGSPFLSVLFATLLLTVAAQAGNAMSKTSPAVQSRASRRDPHALYCTIHAHRLAQRADKPTGLC